MNTITFVLLIIIFAVLWSGTSLVSAYYSEVLFKQIVFEHDASKYKFVYLIKLCLEGPFVFLRYLKK